MFNLAGIHPPERNEMIWKPTLFLKDINEASEAVFVFEGLELSGLGIKLDDKIMFFHPLLEGQDDEEVEYMFADDGDIFNGIIDLYRSEGLVSNKFFKVKFKNLLLDLSDKNNVKKIIGVD